MVHDDALDFTREEFTGRIETDGATFGYVQTSDREARSSLRTNCSEQNRCQVFRVRSGGSWERLHAFARSVIQTRGKPPGTNWFLYDEDRYGWVRLPRYGDPTGGIGVPPGADAHGTLMGLVIVGEVPDAAIVPVIVQGGSVLRETPDGEISIDAIEPRFSEIRVDGRAADDLEILDPELARNWREFFASADIINTSRGRAVPPTALGETIATRDLARMRTMRKWLPQRWRAFTQADVPESERAIWVRPTTNAGRLGRETRGLEMLEIVEFPELRGHTIGGHHRGGHHGRRGVHLDGDTVR